MKVRNAVKAWSPFAVQFKKKYYPWVQLAGHDGELMIIKSGVFFEGGVTYRLGKTSIIGSGKKCGIRQLSSGSDSLNTTLRPEIIVLYFCRLWDHGGSTNIVLGAK